MALIVADRIKETTTSTGTSDIALGGADDGFQAFSSHLSDGDTCWFVIAGGAQWEVGFGTYKVTGNTLERSTVLDSSSGGVAVDFSAGTKEVFMAQPASQILAPSLDNTLKETLTLSPDGAVGSSVFGKATATTSGNWSLLDQSDVLQGRIRYESASGMALESFDGNDLLLDSDADLVASAGNAEVSLTGGFSLLDAGNANASFLTVTPSLFEFSGAGVVTFTDSNNDTLQLGRAKIGPVDTLDVETVEDYSLFGAVWSDSGSLANGDLVMRPRSNVGTSKVRILHRHDGATLEPACFGKNGIDLNLETRLRDSALRLYDADDSSYSQMTYDGQNLTISVDHPNTDPNSALILRQDGAQFAKLSSAISNLNADDLQFDLVNDLKVRDAGNADALLFCVNASRTEVRSTTTDFRNSALRLYNAAGTSRTQMSYSGNQFVINADASNADSGTQVVLRLDNVARLTMGAAIVMTSSNMTLQLTGALLVQDADDSNAELFRVSPNNFDFQTGLLKATNAIFEYDGNTVFHSGNATQFSASADADITGDWTFDGSTRSIVVGDFFKVGQATASNVRAAENPAFVGASWNADFGFGNVVYRARSNSSNTSHLFFAGAISTSATASDAQFSVGSSEVVTEVAFRLGGVLRAATNFIVQDADDSNAELMRATPSVLSYKGSEVLHKVAVPASASSAGVVGQVAFDGSHLYVCTSLNTWLRTALATW